MTSDIFLPPLRFRVASLKYVRVPVEERCALCLSSTWSTEHCRDNKDFLWCITHRMSVHKNRMPCMLYRPPRKRVTLHVEAVWRNRRTGEEITFS